MDKFADLIAKLASVVGVQVERLWPQVVYVYWLRSLGQIIAGCLLFVVFAVVLTKIYRRIIAIAADSYDQWPDHKIGAMVVWSVVLLVLTVAACVFVADLPSLIAAVIAPEASYVMEQLRK